MFLQEPREVYTASRASQRSYTSPTRSRIRPRHAGVVRSEAHFDATGDSCDERELHRARRWYAEVIDPSVSDAASLSGERIRARYLRVGSRCPENAEIAFVHVPAGWPYLRLPLNIVLIIGS